MYIPIARVEKFLGLAERIRQEINRGYEYNEVIFCSFEFREWPDSKEDLWLKKNRSAYWLAK